jgi:hypothetical protein
VQALQQLAMNHSTMPWTAAVPAVRPAPQIHQPSVKMTAHAPIVACSPAACICCNFLSQCNLVLPAMLQPPPPRPPPAVPPPLPHLADHQCAVAVDQQVDTLNHIQEHLVLFVPVSREGTHTQIINHASPAAAVHNQVTNALRHSQVGYCDRCDPAGPYMLQGLCMQHTRSIVLQQQYWRMLASVHEL